MLFNHVQVSKKPAEYRVLVPLQTVIVVVTFFYIVGINRPSNTIHKQQKFNNTQSNRRFCWTDLQDLFILLKKNK